MLPDGVVNVLLQAFVIRGSLLPERLSFGLTADFHIETPCSKHKVVEERMPMPHRMRVRAGVLRLEVKDMQSKLSMHFINRQLRAVSNTDFGCMNAVNERAKLNGKTNQAHVLKMAEWIQFPGPGNSLLLIHSMKLRISLLQATSWPTYMYIHIHTQPSPYMIHGYVHINRRIYVDD